MGRLLFVFVVVVAACGSEAAEEPPAPVATDAPGVDESLSAQRYPDVVAVEAVPADDGTWNFSVTVSSPYDSASRYADAFRLSVPDGRVLALRELTHPHQDEQPFTRSVSGVAVPDDVQVVTAEGRDLRHGWGGDTVSVELPR